MAKLFNLARMTTATTGTGTITLGASVSGYLTFAQAGASDGDTISYAISDGANSEIGTGVYTASGTTMTRIVGKSTNANTAISLSGSAQIAITERAEDFLAFDSPMSLTDNQKSQGRSNIGVEKKNYIINGAMMISQENGTTAGSTTGFYAVDQFFTNYSGTTGTISTAQVASPTPGGSPNRLRVTVTAADVSVGVGDIVFVQHKIEGYRVADLKLGTASAKTVILQFGVKAPAGTYCVVFGNSAINRTYVGEYTIAGGEANTDVVKSVSLILDTTGTWLTNNGTGLYLILGLMAGSTFQQAAGSWSTGNVVGSSNQFNFMGTNGNVFELFDVGLYEGSVAPAFIVPDYPKELAGSQRYFYSINDGGSLGTEGPSPGSGYNISGTWSFPVRMRITPTGTIVGTWTVGSTAQPTLFCISPSAFTLTAVSNAATGQASFTSNGSTSYFTANARL
jgi:hypothetical protein